jgi:hypothetical protein
MRQGQRARTAADLNAIATALEAYKTDFGDYPRLIYGGTLPYNGTGSGASLLGKALLGLGGQDGVTSINGNVWTYSGSTTYFAGQVVLSSSAQYVALQTTTGNPPAAGSLFWQPVPIGTNDPTGQTGGGFDGADGPGFRVRPGTPGQTWLGHVYGPYLQSDKFKPIGLAIADSFGNPILYYPANPARPSVTLSTGTVGSGGAYVGTAPAVVEGTAPTTPSSPCQSLYNYSDNDTVALNLAAGSTAFTPAFSDIKVMEAMLGDYGFNGYIASGETPATTAAYLLWSAGPDGVYGPVGSNNVANFTNLSPTAVKNLVSKCDDVTNFSFAQ